MPVNEALIAVNKALSMVRQSIVAVELALDNNPTPDDAMKLQDELADLKTLEDELIRTRDGIRNGSITMPPPDASLMLELQKSISAVESAAIAGTAASSVLKATGEALALGLAVMSLADK